jgi:site-specific DNA recombinase
MKRTAIYARFSTELQNERSIDDQTALCRSYAERNGLSVVAIYDDRARSGASIYGRDGLMRLMDAARDGKFDLVLVEALDRLSRDQEDPAGIWKRLNFLGIYRTPSRPRGQGRPGPDRCARFTWVAVSFRPCTQGPSRDGRRHSRRPECRRPGLWLSPVPGKKGELTIVEDEADVIRRIFREYVAGKTPREIAHSLNKEGVRPPRGKHWGASAINGSKKRHHGVILNEIYAGVLVWNRVRMVKNPDTGRRISRLNPESEWKRVEVPQLAIVDRDVFEAAQCRKADRSYDAPERQRKAKFLLSGLIKCGCCGGGMSMKDRDHGRVRIHCTTMREAGVCSNRKIFYMDEVEQIVLGGLQKHLKAPHLLREFAEAYQQERQRLASKRMKRRSQIENELAQLQRSIDRVWDDYLRERIPGDMAGPKLNELKSQKEALETERAEQPAEEKIVGLHPAALQHYEKYVSDLQGVFGEGPTEDNEEADRSQAPTVYRKTTH